MRQQIKGAEKSIHHGTECWSRKNDRVGARARLRWAANFQRRMIGLARRYSDMIGYADQQNRTQQNRTQQNQQRGAEDSGTSHGEESPTFLRHSKPRNSKSSSATKGNAIAQFSRIEWESRTLMRGRTSATCNTNSPPRSTHSRSRRQAGRRAAASNAKMPTV